MNEFRQLDDLVRSAAREPLPPVDWQRVERGLFDRIDREPVRPSSPRHPWGSVVAIAAAAAVIAAFSTLAGSGNRSHSDTNSVSPGTVLVSPDLGQPSAAIAASQLHERDRIESGPNPILVRHPGLAAWNLEPRSRVVVERLGSSVQLSLEAGKVRIEVTPGSDYDAFVVRVDDTTVSVHGTVFSVERLADRASVHVEQGAVSVGSQGKRGSVASWLMVAPSAGVFSLDGARVAAFSEPSSVPAAGPPVDRAAQAPEVFVPAPSAQLAAREMPAGPHAQPPAVPPAKQPGQPAASAATEPEAAAASEALPERLTPAIARATLDRLAVGISDCHRRLHPSRPGDRVQVTVNTNLAVTVAAEGNVTLGRFDPPLAPDVQACAASVLLSARFPQARGASQLQLPLHF